MSGDGGEAPGAVSDTLDCHETYTMELRVKIPTLYRHTILLYGAVTPLTMVVTKEGLATSPCGGVRLPGSYMESAANASSRTANISSRAASVSACRPKRAKHD